MLLVDTKIRDSRATASSTSSGATAAGGGIYASVNQVTLQTSSVSGSTAAATSTAAAATAIGGGINLNSSNIQLHGSKLTGSLGSATGATTAVVAGGGGALTGPTIIVRSQVASNAGVVRAGSGGATGAGGGLNTGSALTMLRSTVDGNSLDAASASSNATAAGGGLTTSGGFSLAGSTVSRNEAGATSSGANQAIAVGGGLYASGGGAAVVANSTAALNRTDGAASPATGTGTSIGGGIYTTQAMTLRSVTIASNRAVGTGNTLNAGGAGISREGAGTVTLGATILSKNTGPGGSPSDCAGVFGSDGYNLIGSTAGCGLVPVGSDLLNEPAKLGKLGNHGGPTHTMVPKSGSEALDAIPKASCPEPRDQRGVKRPQGNRCDIGSVEVRR